MVLGIEWLVTLGDTTWNFDKLTMQFSVQGKRMVLREALLLQFDDIFQEPTTLRPTRPGYDHKIPLVVGGNTMNKRPYRYAKHLVVLVGKTYGSWRLCVDYRDLNKQTIKDRFHIPLVDDLLDELHGSMVFSKINLRSGYNQVQMEEGDIHKTAFKTYDGHFLYLVMPFGLTNASATFQGLMNDVFKDYLVLLTMRQNSLYAKKSKCYFGVERVEYLGHFITKEGVSTDPAKILAVKNWPNLTRFVQGYGGIARPLANMLKKDSFYWFEEAKAGFQSLKDCLTQSPIFALPIFSKVFVIEVDASAFQQKWLVKLMEFDFTIEFKQGRENLAVDALSRQESVDCQTLTNLIPKSNMLTRIRDSWQTNVSIQKLLQELQTATSSHKHYTWNQNELRRKGRLVVGKDGALRNKLLHWVHACFTSGHSGRDATLKRLKFVVYWRGMTKDVRRFVLTCEIYQKCKYDTSTSLGLLQPLQIPERIWQHITMDFIEGLPASKCKQVIYVRVDRLSKVAHFMSLKHPYSATEVAQSFLDNVFKFHGFPDSITSDRDAIFVSQFWKELMSLQGVQLQFSSAYHPQTDGQSEVMNRCLETFLRYMCCDTPHELAQWLPLVEWWYNTNHHIAIKCSPYEVMFGQPPPLYLPYLLGDQRWKSLTEVCKKERRP
ncbi:hypothetical protein V8G54_022183 [Vigna mungo]|uniref:Integrase catalytic domain-containing protein n=1 Tax=Vigna mungo TaxID=3915 RepID=A0AAQ3RWH8_VIGMU